MNIKVLQILGIYFWITKLYLSSLKVVNMLKTKIYIILAILAVSLFEETYAKGGMGKNSGRRKAWELKYKL